MSNNKRAQKENKTKQENQTVMQERHFMEHWKWWDGLKENPESQVQVSCTKILKIQKQKKKKERKQASRNSNPRNFNWARVRSGYTGPETRWCSSTLQTDEGNCFSNTNGLIFNFNFLSSSKQILSLCVWVFFMCVCVLFPHFFLLYHYFPFTSPKLHKGKGWRRRRNQT